jgi:cytochrome c oxidase assembly protein Cox11
MTDLALTRASRLRRYNRNTLYKLVLVVIVMAGFGYAMVPMYKSICEALGVNVLARGDVGAEYGVKASAVNTQNSTPTRAGPGNSIRRRTRWWCIRAR